MVAAGPLRIALFGLTFGLNGKRPPPSMPWLVDRLDLEVGWRDFDRRPLAAGLAAAEEADFRILSVHWGLEHERYPTPEQVELARGLAELGFDAILGHHPHVVQPHELYRTARDPRRVVPIFYSLGNWVNGFSAPHLCRGLLTRLTLERFEPERGEGRTYVTGCQAELVDQCVDPGSRQLSLRPLHPAPLR